MAEPANDDRLRFHLDEAVDPDVARALAKHGIDVTTTSQAGLRTEPDTAHFAYARRTGRVVVTHDADFLRLAARTTDHPGIAYCAGGAADGRDHRAADPRLRGAARRRLARTRRVSLTWARSAR